MLARGVLLNVDLFCLWLSFLKFKLKVRRSVRKESILFFCGFFFFGFFSSIHWTSSKKKRQRRKSAHSTSGQYKRHDDIILHAHTHIHAKLCREARRYIFTALWTDIRTGIRLNSQTENSCFLRFLRFLRSYTLTHTHSLKHTLYNANIFRCIWFMIPFRF